MEKFIYTFDKGVKDRLIELGYILISSDVNNNKYVFENDPQKSEKQLFDFSGSNCFFSNKLTF